MSNYSTVPALACNASAALFTELFGADIINISGSILYCNHPSIAVRNVEFCNITVTYTHPAHNDTIHVETWLFTQTWNRRLQAIGGGGWVAGRFAMTDIGMALGDLASIALNGQYAVLAKELIRSFYGRPAGYSYWSGCSQGSKQGFMLAQRYPNAYDCITGVAPALNWAQCILAASWAQVMMSITGQYPPKCEVNALTDAVVAACDPLDGVTDGLISDMSKCTFDPFALVEKTAHCPSTNTTIVISHAAATIANLSWTGPRKRGAISLARRELPSTSYRLRLFIKKNPEWDYSKIGSVEEYARLFYAGVQECDSIVRTVDPDLSALRKSRGKILAYHGLADGFIPTRGTENYYKRVNDTTSAIDDLFRDFEVPGLAHCSGGHSGQPTSTFQALVGWAEKGVVPDTLPIEFNDMKGIQHQRILCPYPEKASLKEKGLDVTKRES
ncbi:tannase and feruloyl esterase [Macroventuria anomochaeta]|uniref:Tannase and feruloyl esterase n=1 Tax=Macroventuria anomochaeta TaxID=301207 RepID=A0ACB6RZ85_9PLEO|nr:tannase and feruloyl esterase [Macroventuria anomochaeta]KAF2626197.1 tannase and feruloyl esterase [Macroventuria anomochaeta]